MPGPTRFHTKFRAGVSISAKERAKTAVGCAESARQLGTHGSLIGPVPGASLLVLLHVELSSRIPSRVQNYNFLCTVSSRLQPWCVSLGGFCGCVLLGVFYVPERFIRKRFCFFLF